MDKTVRTFLVLTASQRIATGWFFSTYVLFLLSHGLNLLGANSLNLIFMTVNLLLNTPAGYLADVLGQKKIFVIGQVFWGLSMAIYWLGSSFVIFGLAEGIGAVGSALMYGTLESWLRNNTNEKETHAAISQSGTYNSLIIIPSALLGGVIGEAFGYEWPWFLAALNSFIVCLLACHLFGFLKKPKSIQTKETLLSPSRWPKQNGCRLRETSKKERLFSRFPKELRNNLLKTKEFLGMTWKITAVRYSFIISLVSFAAFQPLNMFWSPIFKNMTGESWWLGFMWIGISIAIATGSHFSGKMNPDSQKIAWSLFAIGAPLLIAALIPEAAVVLMAFIIHEAGRGALQPTLFTYGNRDLEDKLRTTVNSLRGTFQNLGSAIGLAVSGILTLWFSPLSIWGLSAVVLLFLGACLVANKDKK